jgi:anti-sigma B factor antagonist
MREVTRLDSAGIGMLVSKFLTARRLGGAIKLIHLTDRSGHLMEITRLSTVFEIFQDEDQALRSFGVGLERT